MSRRDRVAKKWLFIQPAVQNPLAGGGAPAVTYSISGQIDDAAGDGIENVLVTLSGDASDTDTTDSDGLYSFTGLSDGSYTVTPTINNGSFIPASRAAEVSGSNVSLDDIAGFVMAQPYVENFEADTAGDNETTMEASILHYDVGTTGVTVQAIDYSTLPAIARTDFTQCITNQQVVVQDMAVSAGEGFTPSDGNVVLIEGVFWCTGAGAQIEIYCRDADYSDGFLVGYVNNGNTFLDTIHSGNTRKLNGTDGVSTVPHGGCWAYFGVQYSQADNNVYTRVIEFGAALSEDSGWVHMGTVASPTFDDSEWVHFQCIARSDTTALQGVAQCRVCEQVAHGYGLGQLEVHSYVDPT